MLLWFASALAPLWAHEEQLPNELEGVGVKENLGGRVPLDLEFRDESGQKVKLADYFQRQRPVLLSLNYYRCPMLCHVQLDGVVDALRQLNLTAGKEFEFITASINPLETPSEARLKKQEYLQKYGKAEAAAGWHFLTGSKENIEALTKAVGFQYRLDPATGEYAHPAMAAVLTPQGRISRYLYGVEYRPQTMRLSLVEASGGKIGSPLDQVILYCFHYDASRGRYAPVAINIMRLGGLLTVTVLAAMLGTWWARERRAKSTKRDVPVGQ